MKSVHRLLFRPMSALLLTGISCIGFSAPALAEADNYDWLSVYGPSLGAVGVVSPASGNATVHLTGDFAVLFVNASLDVDTASGATTVLGGVGLGHVFKVQAGEGGDGRMVRVRCDLDIRRWRGTGGGYTWSPRLVLLADKMQEQKKMRYGAGLSVGFM